MWLLGRVTGYRLHHLLGFVLLLAATFAGVSAAFWWLGEHADSALGFGGVLLVALAYLAVTPLAMMASALFVGRRVFVRLRRRAELYGFGFRAGDGRSGVRISF